MKNSHDHTYSVKVEWSGNLGHGTLEYTAYSRSHEIVGLGKPPILGSADPAFRGDPRCYNPEELLVSSLSTCHMLWYLHLCSEAGVVVLEYVDQPVGIMVENSSGEGRFIEVCLKPLVRVGAGSNLEKAKDLHKRAHSMCFIASSVNFPVKCESIMEIGAL